MLQPRLFQPNSKSKAQALVEFTLTAMLLLLMLTLIIEVARIFQAYVTLQSAARAGARYAITGQWYPQYAGTDDDAGIPNKRSGWVNPTVPNTSIIPLNQIPPCWPRFEDFNTDNYPSAPQGDSYVLYPYTDTGFDKYEPYRDARTCSIEATAIRGMTGLVMDPVSSGKSYPADGGLTAHYVCCYTTLNPNAPYTYEIAVFGYTDDKYPSDGGYSRPDPDTPTVWADWWGYDAIPYYASQTTPVGGLVRGYGGDPGQKVSVQIRYRLGFITPILSRIIPSIQLTGIATMTNEPYGSMGVQSSAVLPPPLPELPMASDPIPPDLTIDPTSYTIVGVPPNPAPNQDVVFTAQVKNIGFQSTTSSCALRLYGVKGAPLPSPVNAASLAGATVLGPDVIIPAGVLGGTPLATSNVTVQFPSSGTWYVYAFVDADNVIDEAGIGLNTYNPTREDNNITAPLTVLVTNEANLALSKTVDNRTPTTGSNVTYTVKLTNLGGANAQGIDLTDILPAGLTQVSANPSVGSYTGGHWTITTLNKNATATLTIVAKVTAATGTNIVNQVSNLTMGGSVTDPDHSNDMTCTTPVGAIDNCRQATIFVGALNLSIAKSVSDPHPSEGSANPFSYTLVVKNTSGTAATNVIVTDVLPSNVTIVTPLPSGCTNSGATVTCTIASLAAGANTTLIIKVYANPGSGGQSLVNTASVKADQPDPDQSDNTSSASVQIQAVDIEISKTVSPLYVAENNAFTWTITAKNNGPDVANNVTVLDNVPTAALGAVTYTPAASYNTTTHIWTIGTLNVGQTKTLTISSSPLTGQNNKTIVNTATLNSVDKTDINSGNNTSTVNLQVTNATSADLGITKTVTPTIAGPGTNVTYTFTAVDNGPKPASGVTVTDTLLSGAITSGFFTCSAGCSTTNSATKFNTTNGVWAVGSMNPGDVVTLNVTVNLVGNSTTSTFSNSATIASVSPNSDFDPTNNTSSAPLTINWPTLTYINPGGNNCTQDVWGASDGIIGADRVWQLSQPYVAGALSWGIWGSNWAYQPLFNGVNYIDSGGAIPAPGQNLMGCTVIGSNFYYQRDNVIPGLYQIDLVFSDPNNPVGQHRFNVDVTSYRGKRVRMVRNFDINKTIELKVGPPYRDTTVTPNNVKYYVVSLKYRVKAVGSKPQYIQIHFYSGSKSRLYTVTSAMVSGVGIKYVSP